MKRCLKILATWMLMAAAASCVYAPPPLYPDGARRIEAEPLPAKVLLIIPDTFAGFVYVNRLRGGEVRHFIGEEATDGLVALFRRTFRSVETIRARDEAQAGSILAAGSPELEMVDYAALPRFGAVDARAKPREYGFDIDIILELYPADMSKVTKIKGKGESTTGVHTGLTPQESVRTALHTAIEAVEDGLVRWRESL